MAPRSRDGPIWRHLELAPRSFEAWADLSESLAEGETVEVSGEVHTRRTAAEQAVRFNMCGTRALRVLVALMSSDDDFVQVSANRRLTRAQLQAQIDSSQQ